MAEKKEKITNSECTCKSCSTGDLDVGDGIVAIPDLYKAIKDAGEFVYDLETSCLSYREGYIEGVAFYVPPTKNNKKRVHAWYPFTENTYVKHVDGIATSLRPAMNREEVMRQLKPIFENPTVLKISANGKFDDEWLMFTSGLDCPIKVAPPKGDSMLVDYLSDERRHRYGLKVRVFEVFGHQMTTYEEASQRQGMFSFMDPVPLGAYALQDCFWTYALHQDRLMDIRKQDPSGKLEKIYWNIEMPLRDIIVEMETTGCLLDYDHLVEVSQRLNKQKAEIFQKIITSVGWAPNLRSPKQVSDFLYNSEEDGGLGLPTDGLEQGVSGEYSTAEKIIKHFGRKNELVNSLLEYRSLDVIDRSFAQKLAKIAQEEGRVHSNFSQTGTVVSRLASSKPVNLMNQPREKNMIRKAFVARLKDDKSSDLHLLNGDYCVDVNQRIATAKGYIRLKDVKVGNSVNYFHNKSARVSKYIPKGLQATKKLTTKCGYELIATDLHRIRVLRRNKFEWVRICNLLPSDKIAMQVGQKNYPKKYIKLPEITYNHVRNKKLKQPFILNEETAEFFGFIAGDGSIQESELSFVVNDNDLNTLSLMKSHVDKLLGAHYSERSYSGVNEVRISSKPLTKWLKGIGLGKQNVPDAIWASPKSVICSYLRGLFEADGTMGYKSLSSYSKSKNYLRITLTSSRKSLIDDVQKLLLYVGIPSTRPKASQNGLFKAYTLSIPSTYVRKFAKEIGFISERKEGLLNSDVSAASKSNTNSPFDRVPYKKEDIQRLQLLESEKKTFGQYFKAASMSKKTARTIKVGNTDLYYKLNLDKILEYGLFFDDIKSIEDGPVTEVADLSVPGDMTYISGGFVSHNSQVELRIAASLSNESNMLEVYQNGSICVKNCDRYALGYECKIKGCKWEGLIQKGNPVCGKCGSKEIEHQARCRHMDLHQRTSEDVSVPRNPLAKNLNFGLLYRLGPAKFVTYADLYDKDGNPMEDYAREVIAKWHKSYPGISYWHQVVEEELKRDKWIAYNLLGRQRRLDQERKFNDFKAVTQAIQFRVSSLAQECIKLGMIKVYKERERLVANSPPATRKMWERLKFLIQVHDELMWECPGPIVDDAKALIKPMMEGVAKLKAPLVFAIKSADGSWEDCH